MRKAWKWRFLVQKDILWYLPITILIIFLFIAPVSIMLSKSLHAFNYARPSSIGTYIGVQNYSEALHNEAFFRSFKRLLSFFLITLTAETILAIFIAHILKGIEDSRPLLSILLIPTISAPVVVGLLGRFMLNTSFGIIPYVIGLVFGKQINILSKPNLAFIALAIVEIWHWTPLLTLIFYSGLIVLPRSPYDAAKVDGASSWNVFWYITLPTMMPVIVAGVVIRGIDLFKIFDEILVMTGGGPGDATELLNFFIYKLAFRSWNVGQASAIGVLVIGTMLPLTYVLYKIIGGGRGN